MTELRDEWLRGNSPLAGRRGLGYSRVMSSEPASPNRSAAAGIVGLAADQLSDALDSILSGAAEPPAAAEAEPDLLRCDYEPIQLEDLLCGLEPLPDGDEFAGLSIPAQEPALLLTEIAQPSPLVAGGWATDAVATEMTALPDPQPALTIDPLDSLRQADPGAMVEVVATLAEIAPTEPQDADEPVEDDDQVLLLTDEFLAEDAEPEPEQEPEPESETGEAAELRGMVDALIAAHQPANATEIAGDADLPERLDALALLLSDPPPTQDFTALDALYACWPKTTQNSSSRTLLAVAYNLSRNFGLPNKLPMSSSKAWRMLSPTIFESELAQRLVDVGTFIADWQKTQRTFLMLDFGEVELIEHLFESLHPGTHADLLAGVMNFKVLSNRRMGLLRRIPNRLKRQLAPLLPDRKEEALIVMAHTKALLERLADPSGFTPIVNTADKMLEELDKMMKATAAMGAPPPPAPPGGGLQLGRMG